MKVILLILLLLTLLILIIVANVKKDYQKARKKIIAVNFFVNQTQLIKNVKCELYIHNKIEKALTFDIYNPATGITSNTLPLFDGGKIVIIVTKSDNTVVSKTFVYSFFEDSDDIEVMLNNNNEIELDPYGNGFSNVINKESFGRSRRKKVGQCHWYNPKCCIVDGVCELAGKLLTVGGGIGCSQLAEEWATICELAGGGPEDPFADECAAMAIPLIGVCAASQGVAFEPACKAMANCK